MRRCAVIYFSHFFYFVVCARYSHNSCFLYLLLQQQNKKKRWKMSAHYETGLFSGYPSINRWQQHQKHLTILLYFDNNHWQTFYRHWKNTVVTFWWIRIFDVIIDAAQQRKKTPSSCSSVLRKKNALSLFVDYIALYIHMKIQQQQQQKRQHKKENEIFT